ncbi:TCR/Tet family MFS transporter [Leptospira kmetyi]|uniref:Tetracycline resistance MFS efflux pump n=1 Tax=Leptospira kmetyi TaxID=408139 RepID=A0ABX4NCF6_9LEPT|nr:tetracycline resistance MFS efflux pump [Leptospira kmetyi]EQA54423.1 transporter, major facilitator family protein [Leptospira kmetyi serovar Malaysia str. Bejo-Iso9]PJZ31054.1 tetracycline resistance MFS efflux pump [Leptospira kmetyi]TGK18331.1 tetracycline resistance MFS efflux pump [Leptospira kmetyi]TGK26713.1 tetracycline resistance MFS efflux pump [Leptospira kmetyi]TGL67840.1 tetracycline resistance MFS efflux pump [Leptospira kmetyi]
MNSKRPAALGFIFVTILIDVIGFGIIIPVLPKLIQELTHGSLSEAAWDGGLLMFAYSIVQFVCAPFVGALSDRYGRRPILLASLFGFALDYLFLTFAPSILWLFVGRVVAGIMGASFTTGYAYIADISPPEKRAENFGILGAAFGLGFIIGPVIGGSLGQFGSRAPFLVAAGFALLNWLFGYFILPESLAPENRRKFEWKKANPIGSLINLKRYPMIVGLVVAFFLINTAAHAVQGTWNYYTMEKFKWDEAMVGYSLGVVGFVYAITLGVLIRIILPVLGQNRSIYLGLTLSALGYALFALATKSWMMFVFLIPYCLGGIAMPPLQGIMSSQVPANEQGELQGALTSLTSVTAVIGPILMTGLFSYFTAKGAPVYSPEAPLWMGTILTAASLWISVGSLRKHHS